MGEIRGLGVVVGAAVALVLSATDAHAQDPLPPAAQPGATQPRDLTSPLPEYQEPFRIEIPPLIERPLGVDEGVRIFVTAFELRGILQDPNAPTLDTQARAAVQREFERALELVEQQRLERQQQTEVGDDGFTPAERERVVEFMARAVREMSPEERAREYQALVDELTEARLVRDQGLTIGQIQQVADAVTAVYQQAGFFLARAIVPAQEVQNGVVVIQVLEGRVGATHAENNAMYADALLTRPFRGLTGELITVPAMEDALLVLSDYPGLQAFGTFRPGDEVGTADIVVSVQDEDRFEFSTRGDNHGTPLTGEWRVSATMSMNNPLGLGDQLGVTLMRTLNPDNTTLGQLNYRLPFRNPRNRLVFDASRNAFDIAGNTTLIQLRGISETASLGWERVLTRSRNRNWYFQTDFARKRGETLRRIGTSPETVQGRDDLAVLGLQVRFDRIVAESNVIASGFLRLDHGFDDLMGVPTNEEMLLTTFLPRPSRIGSVPEFDKLSFGYSRLKAVSPTHTVLFRLAGQWTDDLLAPLEQFAVGGPNQVRALPVSHHLGDFGGFASLEWTARTGQNWTMGLFYDWSVAFVNQPIIQSDRRFEAGGYGVALGYNIPGRWTAKLNHAWVTGGKNVSAPPGNPNRFEDGTQTWFDLSYRF